MIISMCMEHGIQNQKKKNKKQNENVFKIMHNNITMAKWAHTHTQNDAIL